MSNRNYSKDYHPNIYATVEVHRIDHFEMEVYTKEVSLLSLMVEKLEFIVPIINSVKRK